MFSRKSRGYALTAALAVLFIVFTVAIALQYQTSLARSTYLRAEAEFQAELALENQIALDLLQLRDPNTKARAGSAPDIGVKAATAYDTDRRKGAAAEVFTHLPATRFEKPQQDVKAGDGLQRLVEYQPTSVRPEFRLFDRRKYAVVYTAGFPFAGFAPKGKIELEECYPGGNPPKGRIEGKPEDFRSGIPACLGAGKDVKVSGTFPYGEVYTLGKASLAPGTNGVLLHAGVLPFESKGKSYSGELKKELERGYSQLEEAALPGDKTRFILGKSLLSARELFKALVSFGDVRLQDILDAIATPSLNQAMAFPLPAIPTVSIGILYNEITFHMPFPPDQGLYSTLQSKADELVDRVGKKLDNLGKPFLEAQKKVLELRRELDQRTSEAVNQAVQAAQGPLNQAQQQLNDIQNRYNNALSRTNAARDAVRASSTEQTRAALAAAEAELNRVNDALNSTRDQVANLQNQLNRAGDEARARIQAQYQAPLDAAQAQLQQLANDVQTCVEQAKAFSKEATGQIVASLPGDPKGLATRALEEASAIDETLGAPGVNYLALAILAGKTEVNLYKRALEKVVFNLIIKFVSLICPGGKLVVKVQTPEGFEHVLVDFQIPTYLLDPDVLEAAYRLRNLSIKEALLEYLQPYLDSLPQNEVRVVNFGHPDNPTEEAFEFDNQGEGLQATGFKSVCTWNVPEGRTLMLRGNVTIKGDVWVQRGASMVVKGNLTVVAPPPRTFHGIDNPLCPSGRIFLEPGATLLVEKNLTCTGGTPLGGSVVVESPLGQAAPITSAILCRGDLSLKYGVHPGLRVDNLFGYVGEVANLRELQTIQEKVLTPLLTELAPNAAKIFGPFHMRKPYIAQFATTVSLYFIIPGPGPTYPNILVRIYRMLAAVYGVSMNAVLGENLYTQSDWWVFGDGVVPIVPRVDAETLVDNVRNIRFRMPHLTDPLDFFEKRLQQFVERVVTRLIGDAISTALGEIVNAIANVLQVGKQLSVAAGAIVDTFLNQFRTSINDIIHELEKEFELTVEAGVREYVERPLRALVNDLIRQVEGSVEKSVLRDAPGALLYAGGSLTIGSATDPPPLAVGMFIAKGMVNVQAERCLGSLLSLEGDVKARKLIFNPFFTTASLYVPKSKPDWNSLSWPAATLECKYGGRHGSETSLDIGPAVYHTTNESWKR